MAKYPHIPLFTDAYLADTRHLTAAQHGAYLLLMFMAWRSPGCCLPDDDKTLARWACMDLNTWKRNKDVVMAFWELRPQPVSNNPVDKQWTDSVWVQPRLLRERFFVSEVSRQKSAAGKASALKRKSSGSTYVPTEPQQDGNTYTYTKNKPPLPPKTPEAERAAPPPAGDFKNGIGNGSGYDVRQHLTDEGWQAARRAAPGWDVQVLAVRYNAGLGRRGGKPSYPDRAFPKWCGSYTKGRRPD